MADAERFEQGRARFGELMGRDIKSESGADEFMDVTFENLFGDIWNREGLSLRDRSMITCAALIALGKEEELKVHFRGLLNQGVTADEIDEMIIHLAHYGGWPNAVAARRAATSVFEKTGAR